MSNKFLSETKRFRLSFFPIKILCYVFNTRMNSVSVLLSMFSAHFNREMSSAASGGRGPAGLLLYDVARGVTGGYFQNGRNCKVLEGNPDIFIYSVRIPSATTDAPGRATNNITRLHVSARQKTGTMSVSIGDKIEVSSFVRLTPTS